MPRSGLLELVLAADPPYACGVHRTTAPMSLTPHQVKYFAHDLTRRAPSGMDRLSMSLFDAAVDLNPHQIEAALFALQSPLSKGVILADEVGLGKTIEAGIVLCQFWAERKRRLLVICPASIRKQWALELEEKFNLPALVLDAKAYREAQAKRHDAADSETGCRHHVLQLREQSARGTEERLPGISSSSTRPTSCATPIARATKSARASAGRPRTAASSC